MQNELFYNIIKENSINGELIGEWHGLIGKTEFMLVNMGSSNKPLWLATNKNTDEFAYYNSFEDTLQNFKINDISLKEQIEKIDKFEVIEVVN